MGGYERDEYEDYDEYDEEGYEQEEEGEEEEEYEEEQKPSAEELEYLELRARIKEQIRRKMQRGKGAANSRSQEIKKKVPSDSYGSFFGPSQPVIAQRVIQESKSLLENPHLAFKASNSHNDKRLASTGTGSKNGVSEQMPKIRKELKTKVQKLKDTRDYSFILSDDAEIPAPTKQPVPQTISTPKSEARSAQLLQRNRQISGHSVRDVHGVRDERKSNPTSGRIHSKSEPQRSTFASKPMPSKSVDPRRQLGSNNGIGLGRPAGTKGLPAKASSTTVERKASAPVPKTIMPATRKPPPPKMQSSVPRQHVEQKRQHVGQKRQHIEQKSQHIEQRRTLQESRKNIPVSKQPLTSSRPQVNKPTRQISSHAPLQNRPKKKPARSFPDDDDVEGENALMMIRKMFGTDRWKNQDDDDDVSDMEANFDEIMKEERISAKIAKKEDEEQLRLIEEEERRERMRMMAKKRKLSQR